MNQYLQDFIERLLSFQRMPPEAYPPRIGLLPGGRVAMQIAWQTMQINMFTLGVAVGIGLSALVVAIVAIRVGLPGYLRGSDATR